MRFEIVPYPQSSPEWLEWRANGITGTDIPIIMEKSPFKTPRILWQEKFGYSAPPLPTLAMKFGQLEEERARHLLIRKLGIEIHPMNVQSLDYPAFRASLDGYHWNTNEVWEIKSPSSILNLNKYRAQIPEYWILQVQWQLMITGAEKGHLVIWDSWNEKYHLHEVKKDEGLWKEMAEKATKFWFALQEGTCPEFLDSEPKELDDPGLHDLAIEYIECCNQEEKWAKKRQELKEKICEFSPTQDFKAYGLRVKTCSKNGSFDFGLMKEDGIDPEKYRKPSSTYKVIVLPKAVSSH